MLSWKRSVNDRKRRTNVFPGHVNQLDNRVIKWNPTEDQYQSTYADSVMLPYISERTGMTRKDLEKEVEQRKNVLHWMREQNIRSYKDVAAIIAEYYARAEEFYARISIGEAEAIAAS